ncbi:Hypothetical predicted protein [Octopus vulgaris]|uniref:Uncharacterized protein n=1 Tax=Octopus vulgaris TaxID=6645 RepID=A0AA36F765_OCTVU|nr:Hypothetical predicted protein [Octopus vulgaris]
MNASEVQAQARLFTEDQQLPMHTSLSSPHHQCYLNLQAKKIMEKYRLEEKKIQPFQPRINFKDHKLNFSTNPSIRLICPSKSDLGRISKHIIDKYMKNLHLRTLQKLDLWSSSYEVIDWFNKITSKK